MQNTVITTIFTERYGEIDVKIVAEREDQLIDFDSAEVYSFWNSDDQTLGWFERKGDQFWYYGNLLTDDEQEQLAGFITGYREDEWDL
jgi:hypothetical protein